MQALIITSTIGMFLFQAKIQLDAIGEREWSFGQEHDFARLIAPTRPGVNAPSRVTLAINGEFDRAIDPFFVRLVVKLRLQFFLSIVEVRRGLDEFHRNLVRPVQQVRRFHPEFRQGGHAFEGATRAIARQVGIGQLFQLKRANGRQIICSPEMRRPGQDLRFFYPLDRLGATMRHLLEAVVHLPEKQF